MEKIDYRKTATAKKGRNGDEFTAHVQPGEIIVPPVISDGLRARLMEELLANGFDPEEITVGEGMSINPETGLPEFGFGKVFKKATKVVKSVVSSPIGQIGLTALGGYYGPALFGAGGLTGAGLGAAGATAAGSALGGAAGGLLSGGGLKGALMGGALGGLGGYAYSGGFGNLLDGTWAGNQLAGTSFGNSLGVSPTFDSIISNPITSTATASAGGGVSSLAKGNLLGNLLSSGLGMSANSDAQDELLRAQQQQLGLLAPYTTAQFNPGDLTQDPGYKFQLEQGQNAINAKNAASGNYYSGAALKDAADYSKSLTDTTYNNAYNRFLQGQQQRYGAAQDLAGIYGTGGTIRANTGINNSNLLSRSLSGILGGGGFNAQGQGYDEEALARILRGGY